MINIIHQEVNLQDGSGQRLVLQELMNYIKIGLNQIFHNILNP